jgi:hypothetical protein
MSSSWWQMNWEMECMNRHKNRNRNPKSGQRKTLKMVQTKLNVTQLENQLHLPLHIKLCLPETLVHHPGELHVHMHAKYNRDSKLQRRQVKKWSRPRKRRRGRTKTKPES